MKKILIVDDEQISLMMANHILATDYQTVCASSSEEAMELYESERPDMVLSDLNMPHVSGYELQKMMEAKYRTSIPFMFMTAEKDDIHESRGFEQGALDFIRKPFRADVLLKRVGNILNTIDKIEGLTKAAFTDPMTGLLNKVSAQKEISKLCGTVPGAFMMIDLDSFKPVNDIYGHDMGDKVLIRFAEILRSAVRSMDVIGRVGGDEFIAYCQNVGDESVIAQKAEYINEQIVLSAKEFMGREMTIPIGASIGCVFAPKDGTDYQDLYLKADKMLYSVKKNGKHGYCVYREDDVPKQAPDHKMSNLESVFPILNERNRTRGAYYLPMEQFCTVYRFLSRVRANYSNEVWILLISLKNIQKSSHFPNAVSDEFGAVMCSCLRQSDVVAKNGANQFIVLLLETTKSNIKLIVERIQANWARTELSEEYYFDFELDFIK